MLKIQGFRDLGFCDLQGFRDLGPGLGCLRVGT